MNDKHKACRNLHKGITQTRLFRLEGALVTVTVVYTAQAFHSSSTPSYLVCPFLVGRPPGLDLIGRELPQLVDARGLASDGPLGYLNPAAEDILARDAVRGRRHLDADDPDAGVVLASVVHPISQVAQPRLQRRAIVLLDQIAVRHHLGYARDGGPLARSVEERDVGVGIALELVRLVGLGVGVEEEIDAAGFLRVYR